MEPMTLEAMKKKIHRLTDKRSKAIDKIVEPAKAAVTALKDAKMENTARRLDEALYELTIVEEEINESAKEYPELFLRALKEIFRENSPSND